MNQWRSPTAERIYRKHDGIAVRSAGTRKAARKTVSATDIEWADIICVMEESHSARLRSDFRNLLGHIDVYVLDIPDDYGFMDPELVLLLQGAVDPIIEALRIN